MARFAFFLHGPTELLEKGREIELSANDIQLLNPLTKTCPLFRSRRDAELTKGIYERVPILDSFNNENGWSLKPTLMFMMNAAMKSHRSADELSENGFVLEGNLFRAPTAFWLPLYEGKMVGMYDHRGASIRFDPTNRVRRNQPKPLSLDQHQDPTHLAMPMFWVPSSEVVSRCGSKPGWLLAVKDVTSAANERTAIAAILPESALTDSLPWLSNSHSAEVNACLLANLNSFALDYVARQKVAGLHLRGHYLAQLAVIAPLDFEVACSWHDRTVPLKEWILPRVLELSYTAHDLGPFARDCGYNGEPFRWDEERRFHLQCELNAAFFHVYDIERSDVEYILETFPIVKKKDIKFHGDFRTKLQILEIYDAMQRSIDTGEPYRTLLDPPPAHRRER